MDVQMEFSLDDDIQKKFEDLVDSMGKVRRKLFGELYELKKQMTLMKQENEELKIFLAELKSDKVEWDYQKEGFLFDIKVG